jgi:SAM-dependent methyltransferase
MLTGYTNDFYISVFVEAKMNNYEFCAHWVCDRNAGAEVRVLDYGCGVGEIVNLLREKDVDAYGCDVFYDGGDHFETIDPELLQNGVIQRMQGSVIPFEDDAFDLVVNNQVLEHVTDIDEVLAEMRRVLKPGGAVLSVFPHKQVWREGHSGIPFLHWFPKQSRARVYYAGLLRSLGAGFNKGDKTVMQWSRDFCQWLDEWTSYRSKAELEASFLQHFAQIHHIEDLWLRQRLEKHSALLNGLPNTMQKLIAVKMAGLVIVASGHRA